MVDNVKLDKISTYLTPQMTENKVKTALEEPAKSQDVAVTSHLNDLLKKVSSIEEPQNASALSDIKYKIQHNEYKIDLDQLSDKLLGSGILTSNG